MGENNFIKPRPPPVPPRPNRQIIDQAIARSTKTPTRKPPPKPIVSKTIIKSNECCGDGAFNKNNLNVGVAGYPKTGGKTLMMASKKSEQHSRMNLGQHVHDTDSILYTSSNGIHHATKRPTVLLIANGKTSVKYGEPETQARIAANNGVGSVTSSKIRQSNWYQLDETSGQQIQYSSCQITVNSNDNNSIGGVFSSHRSNNALLMSLQGLPPLPKSLSGANLLEASPTTTTTTAPSAVATAGPTPPSPDSIVLNRSSSGGSGHQPRIGSNNNNGVVTAPSNATPTELKKSPAPPVPPRKMTTLDTQLAILRKEMVSVVYYIYT